MNGRAARRIHRATWHTMFATGVTSFKEVSKRLKREYKAKPYHKRDLSHMGLRSLTHREQEQRWLDRSVRRIPAPEPEVSKYGEHNPHPDWSGYEPGEPDDHSPFRSQWERKRHGH